MQLSMHAAESSNRDAWAAPDKAVIFGAVSPKHTPCVMPKPVRSVLFLFLNELHLATPAGKQPLWATV
jgi:hypothetical protein